MNDSAIRDPATANCRIYVGNLKENTSKGELQNIFSKYGNIIGIMVSRNFGFIQFDCESNANKAIDNENQKLYNGRKINVSKVQKKNNQKNQSDKGNIGGGGGGMAQNEQPAQNPSNNQASNSGGQESNMNATPSHNMNSNSNNNNSNNNNSNINNSGSNNDRGQSNIGQQHSGPQSNRPNWMRNRNNNRNNNNNNNDMNIHNDRERSPFDNRRDSNNDRWNQDGGNSNFNNFRNNRNNNMNRNNNSNNNNSNMNNAPGNNMGNKSMMGNTMGNTGNMGNKLNMGGGGGGSGGGGGGGSGSGGTGGMNNMNNPMKSNNNNNRGNNSTAPLPFIKSEPFSKTDVKSVLNGGVLQGYASAREIRAKYPNANDCEIVVLEKSLVEYAEFVEGRIKRGGITADLLFPNADLTIGKMLSNIANRGSLYALIIQPQHMENKSVTLNILYGVPSEHRNMPLEDAIALIFRNYQHLCQGGNGDIIGDTDESPYASIPVANSRHPDSVQHLINLLADNRTLTVLQIDCLLKYLQERRDVQYKFELGDTNVESVAMGDTTLDAEQRNEPNAIDDAQTSKADAEEEIQKKLMEILNKPNIPNLKSSEPAVKVLADKKHQPSTSSADSGGPIHNQQPNLLKDPKLRNVLDSLMLDDDF